MIARSWHGIVPIEKAEAFLSHLMKTGVAEAKDTPGNRGVFIHRQSQDRFEHFFMISYWDNMESIIKFAGPHPNVAVTYLEDELYGLISDPIVLHHEIEAVPEEYHFIK